MATKRTQARSCCPISRALDIIGDRWSLVVMRDILLGGRTSFSEIGSSEGIATNTLSERLARLEAAGVLSRERDPADARRRIYLPTDRGRALAPILLDLLVWGADHAGGTAKPELVERVREDREAMLARILAPKT